jgi:uncharacterized cupredoxin-like copper-binding protein
MEMLMLLRKLIAKTSLALLTLLVATTAHSHSKSEDKTYDLLTTDVDWTAAEVVSVLLEDNSFSPEDVELKLHQPYKLVLTNVSDRAKHDLVDLHFFHAVVLKEVVVGGIVVNTHHIHSLELKPNSSSTLYLVPVKVGENDIYCSIEGHREDGMEGYITISK